MSRPVSSNPWTKERMYEYHNAWLLKFRSNNPEWNILRRAKRSAKIAGVPFDLSKEDIVIPAVCPVLGIPIEYQTGHKLRTPNSPSIDRFDHSKGYTKDNINIISWRANELKRNGTLEEFKKLINWMENVA